MAQIPRLSDDVLYIISEKLLFKNRCGDIDLQSKNSFNPYTLFMNHSARNMRAVLSHFSKMKHLDLSTSDNECVIKFYKDVTPEYISHFRKSSYHVNKMIFSGLLEAGLLHISHFKITNILGQLPKIDFSATNKNIYKYLVNLAEGLFDPGSPASSNLNIYSIIVDEPAETIKKHLITLLSMNIETMEIICSNNGNMFECDAKTFELVLLGRPSISMNRTKKIKTKCTIELNSTTNFVNNLMNYIQFLLLCCLNLDSIDLDFTFNSKLKTNFYSYSGSSESTSDDSVSLLSPEEFVTNLELFFITIIDYLKNLEIGGKDLKIKIEFYSSFVDYIFESHILESSISVNKMIFSGLLEACLLHILSIQINKILGKLSEIDFSATNKNIYKYFVNLEDLSDSSSISSGSSISSIYIIESAETIKKHLITLLSMNIETVEIICSNNGNMFECDAKTFARVLLERPSISINCTKKITTKCTIELNSTTNFLNNLLNYIQFLIFCCPNLESVEFLFNSKLKTNLYSYPSSYESISDGFVSSISPEEFVTYLESFFTSIIDYLKNLEIGGKNLKIKIEFYSSFVDYIFELIPTDNKLFSLGKHVEIKNIRPTEGIYSDATPQFIGRNIEVVDSIGRQHGCLVKILSEKQEEDYYINDDYDNYFNGGYGFDEYAYIDAYSL